MGFAQVFHVALLGTALVLGVDGQTGAAVAGAGFAATVPISISPGGVVTIYVAGLGARITSARAAESLPLPTNLAGISVSLRQTREPQGPFPAPLLAVFPVPACPSGAFDRCGSLLGVSIQIPFELAPNTYDQLGSLLNRNFAQLIVSEAAGGTAAVEATPEIDTIHILRRGDTVLNPEMAGQQTATIEPQAMVTHADGRPVNRANPADAGETLVMYLTGLGPANPDSPGARTGEPATRATPISGVRLAFDFRPDSTPGRPAFGSDTAPVFAGMTPGFAGLYQVNFVVPEPPAGYKLRCGTLSGGTNLTVNVARSMRSFDGASICVNIKP